MNWCAVCSWNMKEQQKSYKNQRSGSRVFTIHENHTDVGGWRRCSVINTGSRSEGVYKSTLFSGPMGPSFNHFSDVCSSNAVSHCEYIFWMSVFSTMAVKPLGPYFHTKCTYNAYKHDKRKKNYWTYWDLTLNLSNYHCWMLPGIKIRNNSLLWQVPTALHLLRCNGDKPQTNRTWNPSTAEVMFEKPRWGVNGVWCMNVQHNNDAQLAHLLLPTDGLLKDQ